MEQSSISTNVHIDFQKKTQQQHPQKRTYRPRTPQSSASAAPKKPDYPKIQPEFTPKQWEFPVKVWFLGGLEQVGENMTFFEYKDDILVVDAGLVFPGGDVFGVDYIIPDISYLKLRRDKIKWLIITHGHLDHIGALKHVLPALWYPMIYGSNLTIHMIKKIFEEAKLLKNLKYKVINPDTDILKFGCFTVESFRVNHNIPESLGFAIHTPKWLVVTPWDYKIDFSPAIDKPADMAKIARIWQEGVRLMLGESTNAMKPGRTPSERIIGQNLEMAIKNADNRLIIATFASNIWRVIQIIEAAAKYDKVVFVSWRSMVNNIEIVKQLWYINVPQWFVRKVSEEINTLPDHRVVVLCTGAQGEEFAALTRISRNEDKHVHLKSGDQILMSATPIPGNEKAVITMMNDFVRQGIEVITNSNLDIHASGHAFQEDIKIMTALIKPEYVIPIHGEPIQRNANKNVMLEMAIPSNNVFLIDNGSVIEMYDDGVRVSDKKLKLDTVNMLLRLVKLWPRMEYYH
jgi:ribonuclease J